MADIKTRDVVKGTIKTIDKAAIASGRMKAAYAKTKDKAEQGYFAEESSATEYAADKVSHTTERVTAEGVHQFDKQGQKAVKTTEKNIVKAKDKLADFKQKRATQAAERRAAQSVPEQYSPQLRHGSANPVSAPDAPKAPTQAVKQTGRQAQKTVKRTARSAEKTVKTTAKGSVKTAQKTVKTAQTTSKAAIKTAEQTAKAAQTAAKASAKAAQRAAQVARAAAKATVAAVKAAVKATIAAVKAIIAGTKALIAAIAAGGWVAVVVIVVICLIGLLVGSVFGIFFSGEDSGSGMTMQTVVQEINTEYDNCLDGIKNGTAHDVLEMSGSRAVWKEVLAVYSVKTTTDPDNPQEVATMDDGKKQLLTEIFWEMNEISSRTDNKLNKQLQARLLPLVFDSLKVSCFIIDDTSELISCHLFGDPCSLYRLSYRHKVKFKIVVSPVHKLTTCTLKFLLLYCTEMRSLIERYETSIYRRLYFCITEMKIHICALAIVRSNGYNKNSTVYRRQVMFEYITAQEAAERWDISVRRVQRLCKEGRIEGVLNVNRVWLIPKGAMKPADERYRANKMQKTKLSR